VGWSSVRAMLSLPQSAIFSGVIVFNQGFGEVFAVFGKDGEIRGDIEGNGK
jgi:hypothetical protein